MYQRKVCQHYEAFFNARRNQITQVDSKHLKSIFADFLCLSPNALFTWACCLFPGATPQPDLFLQSNLLK